MSETVYNVKLGADGQWKWTVAAEPKVRASFYNKFPADTTPGYLVDLGENHMTLTGAETTPWPWKVVSVQNLYDEDKKGAETLAKQGWAAISYAWGEFLPNHPTGGYKIRPVYQGPRESNGLPKGYVPPGASQEVIDAWAWPVPTVTQFGVPELKKVFATFKKRFFWWDWVCLPQQDNSQGYWDPDRKDPVTGKVVGYNPPPLKFGLNAIKNTELGKQKYVYGKATVGGIFLSQVTLGTVVNSPVVDIKSLLLQVPQTLGMPTIDAIFKDSLSLKSDPKIPQQILAGALGIANPTTATAAIWQTQITKFKDTLKTVRGQDPWFRSLWSFQEGRLMEKSAFIDKEGRTLTIPNTVTANPAPPFPTITVQVGNKFVQTDAPSMSDLANIATLLAGQVSLAYVNVFGNGTITKPIPQLVELWKTQEPWASTIQRELTSSGILFHAEDAPLELLAAARRSRFPSYSVVDDYFAMLGVLGLVKVDDDNDYTMKDAGNYGKYQDEPQHFDTYINDDLPKYFFKALIKKYQWLMLLFAKKPVDKVNSWKAISLGHYECINPYCEGLMLGNEFLDQPEEWAYSLPALDYDELADEIIISPPQGYVTQPIITAGTPGNPVVITYPARKIKAWTVSKDWSALPRKPVRYTLDANAPDYVDDAAGKNGVVLDMNVRKEKISNRVLLQDVPNAAALGGVDNFLLLPFKSLGFTMSRLGQDSVEGQLGRCLIVTRTAKGMQNNVYFGYFGGIMDVPASLETKDVEVDEVRLQWQAPS